MKGTFSMTSWEEDSLHDLPPPLRLNHGRVTRRHEGVLTGDEVMHFTLAYTAPGRSVFRGVGVFEGTVNGHQGRYAVLEAGEFRDGAVEVSFELRSFAEGEDIGVVLGRGRYTTDRDQGIAYTYDPA